jgi:tRNA 2-thiouridine synthesizing protein A
MADKKLALQAQLCPRPLIAVTTALRTMAPGDTLTVECTDPMVKESLPKLCQRANVTLAETSEAGGVIHFLIKK